MAHLALTPTAADPHVAAHLAGLRYVNDQGQGIQRKSIKGGFRYVAPNGSPLRDPTTLDRIRALGLPPAWTDVWICPLAVGHIQATARDAKGRKQYRYHTAWRQVRDETKFHKMMDFGAALPTLRQQIKRDLARPGLPREKVLATVVRLLEETLIRVGNEEYARKNSSFGLTTMRRRHVRVDGNTLHFHFRGKSGKEHAIHVHDARAARVVRRCQELPGHELFHYINEQGEPHTIDSSDVNDYLHRTMGQAFTAKDFRTWAGTVFALFTLQAYSPYESPTEAKRNVVQAIRCVADRLGNTPAVCRSCYVHPGVLDAYLQGTLATMMKLFDQANAATAFDKLHPEEVTVMIFLQAHEKTGGRERSPLLKRPGARSKRVAVAAKVVVGRP